jgi:hypothetical protein
MQTCEASTESSDVVLVLKEFQPAALLDFGQVSGRPPHAQPALARFHPNRAGQVLPGHCSTREFQVLNPALVECKLTLERLAPEKGLSVLWEEGFDAA